MKTTLGLVAAIAAVLTYACTSPASAPDDPVDSANAAVTSNGDPAKATYVAICGFSIANYDPTDTFRFYVDSTLAHDATTGADTLTLSMTPLVGWDADAGVASPPTVVTRTETVGKTIVASEALTGGQFSAAFGGLDVAPLANGITGGDAHVDNLELDGPFTSSGAPFCAGVSGELTVPLDFQLNRDENTCLFFPIADGDPLPQVQASDFHCP